MTELPKTVKHKTIPRNVFRAICERHILHPPILIEFDKINNLEVWYQEDYWDLFHELIKIKDI